MATCTDNAKYNSPYTGPQLDAVIAAVNNNTLYTFKMLYSGGTSNGGVPLSNLPPKADGTKTGVYDILYADNAMVTGQVSRIIIEDENMDAGGSGHSDIHLRWLYCTHANYFATGKKFLASVDRENLDNPTDPANIEDSPLIIRAIYRLEPVS